MFKADLLIEYEAAPPGPRWSNLSALDTLPSVLDILIIFFFFSFPLSRKGTQACVSSAGPRVFVRTVSRKTSGSSVRGVSSLPCIANEIDIRWLR